MTELLREQLEGCHEAFLRRGNSLEHDRFNLFEFIEVSLSLLQSVRGLHLMYENSVRCGEISVDRGIITDFHGLYNLWYGFAPRILRLIELYESDGRRIDNAERFKKEAHSPYVTGLEPDKLVAAAARFSRGEGKPIKKVMDEVRRLAGR